MIFYTKKNTCFSKAHNRTLFSLVNGGENMTNTENTPKKKRYAARVVLILVLGCIGAFILLDLICYPGTTDFYSLMDLKRGEICEVRFQRYGKIASIRQEKKLQDTLDIFDCDVEKQGPVIHCGCTTGSGRLVIFQMCIRDRPSGEAGSFASAVISSYTMAVQLNLIFAKANLGYKMKATIPLVNDEGIIDLKKARHPLISKDAVVPTNIELGTRFDTLEMCIRDRSGDGPHPGGGPSAGLCPAGKPLSQPEVFRYAASLLFPLSDL